MADSTLPHRPKPEESSAAAAPATENAPGAEGGAAPSKSALKKAAKEKLKAEKAAARAAQEQAQRAANEASDTAVGLYGKLPEAEERVPALSFLELGEQHYEKEVTVVARVDNTRSQSAKLGFLTLRQQGKKLQTVIAAPQEGPVSRQMVKWTTALSINTIVQVTGLAKKPAIPIASATLTELELHVQKVYVIVEAPLKLPMQVKDAERPPPLSDGIEGEPELDAEGAPIVTLKTRLDNRVLDLQTETSQAITWISSGVAQLFTEFMLKSGARWIFTSKLNGSSTEGGSEVFEVKYFKKKAYLAQSPQLHKQICIAGDMGSVFEVGPVFRAEESNTHRHLTEFTGLDFEKTFRHHYHEVLEFAEELLVFILTELKTRYKDEIAVIQKSYPKAGDFKLPKDGKALRLNYMDGVALLKEAGVDTSEQERFENDFTTAMEKKLGVIIREKYDTDFYVLDRFPMAVRPFYTKADPQDPTFSFSYDFFMRGEEIMSGAQRINDVKELEESMISKGLDPKMEGFEDYLAAFRQGCPQHAGGGLGLNRIVMFFLGLPNIRLATLFPRDPQRLRPSLSLSPPEVERVWSFSALKFSRPRHKSISHTTSHDLKMPEKRKTEEPDPKDGDFFPAKRVRQQISHELDDSITSNPVKRSNDSHTNASEGEDGEADWDNKNTTNKQNKYQEFHNQQPRVDPVYGQRSAFPGLDDAGSDELLYGPPEDGLEYLRLVRSEAKSLPSLFIAPKKPKTEQDETHDTEEVLEQNRVNPTSQRVEETEQAHGFVFIDGVVIARSNFEESKAVNAGNTRDAQTSYYNLLKHRFILLRSTLRCTPPATAIAELDDAHPITLPYNVSAARTAWRQLLFTSEPQMAQLACMDMETILGVLRLLGSVVIKCVKDNDSAQLRRVGAWAWGLLGRCRDVGELGSEEVGELRVFGRKAANILKRLNGKKNPFMQKAIAQSGSDSEEFSDQEMGGLEDANQMDTRKDAIQEAPLEMEETVANDELPVPTVESVELEELQASVDLETAKFRLRSRLFSGEDNELEAQESEAENPEIRRRNTSSAFEEEEECNDEASEKEVNANKTPLPKRAETGEKQTRILLDMIVTIVGEFYGQRDLLEQRDIWA